MTNGKGVDHVVEVGGSGTMEQSVACTKRGGLVSSVGFLAEGKKSDLVGPLLYGAKTCELLPYFSSILISSFPLCGTRERVRESTLIFDSERYIRIQERAQSGACKAF